LIAFFDKPLLVSSAVALFKFEMDTDTKKLLMFWEIGELAAMPDNDYELTKKLSSPVRV